MTDEAGVADGATARPPRRKRGFATFLRDIVIVLLAALVISFLIKTFLIESFYIPSGSMMNTLQINDRVIVSRLTPSAVPLARGDIVVFSNPGGWLGPDEAPGAVALELPAAAAVDQPVIAPWLGDERRKNHAARTAGKPIVARARGPSSILLPTARTSSSVTWASCSTTSAGSTRRP